MKRSKEEWEKLQKHEHTFHNSPLQNQHECECGAIKISSQEYGRRVQDWNEYYERVRTETEGYEIYKIGREALRTNDKKMLKDVSQRARELLEEGDSHRLPKPKSQFDPRRLSFYSKLVVTE